MLEESGLYYLQSRYYNPEIGRFINADDTSYLGADGSLTSYNLFAYCNNNPVNLADPAGTIPFADGLLDESYREAGRLIYEFLTGRTHPERQSQKMEAEIIAKQHEIITDIVKTADDAGAIDIGMASYHSIQATRSFNKAIAYAVAPIPTLADEGFAIGFALKGLYHLIKSIGRAAK